MVTILDKISFVTAVLLSSLVIGCVFEPYGDEDNDNGGQHRYSTGQWGDGDLPDHR
jgi:hypothetical protein